MPSILAVLVVISITISLVLLVILIHNRSRYRKLNELLIHFNRMGIENKLSFLKQEIIEPSAIGLDWVNKKLLFVKRVSKEKYKTALADLNEVINVSVKRIKHSAVSPDKKYWLDGSPIKIVLQLEFACNKSPVSLPFYTYLDNHIFEIQQLESRAKAWKAMLSRVISGNARKVALVADSENG